MQANVKKILLVLLLLACIAISVFMFIDEEYVIAAFCILFAVIMAILLYRVIKLNSTPESLFKGTISDILKTYDAILVEVENLPDISDKKLIQTISFKDMVNAEYEFRKPIYYIHNEYAYDFILFNKDDAYVYTVKVGNDKISIVEKYLAEKITEKNNSSSDLDMLDSLENTTVIKLNEDKEYLVSPVRKDDTNTNTNDNTSNIQAQEPMVQDNIVPEVNNEIQSNSVVEESTINTDSTSNTLDTIIQEPVQNTIVQDNIVPEVNNEIQSSPVVEETTINTDSTSNISDTTIQEPVQESIVQDSVVPEVNTDIQSNPVVEETTMNTDNVFNNEATISSFNDNQVVNDNVNNDV